MTSTRGPERSNRFRSFRHPNGTQCRVRVRRGARDLEMHIVLSDGDALHRVRTLPDATSAEAAYEAWIEEARADGFEEEASPVWRHWLADASQNWADDAPDIDLRATLATLEAAPSTERDVASLLARGAGEDAPDARDAAESAAWVSLCLVLLRSSAEGVAYAADRALADHLAQGGDLGAPDRIAWLLSTLDRRAPDTRVHVAAKHALEAMVRRALSADDERLLHTLIEHTQRGDLGTIADAAAVLAPFHGRPFVHAALRALRSEYRSDALCWTLLRVAGETLDIELVPVVKRMKAEPSRFGGMYRPVIDETLALLEAEAARRLTVLEALRRRLTRRFGTLSPSEETRLLLALRADLERWLGAVDDVESVEALLDRR